MLFPIFDISKSALSHKTHRAGVYFGSRIARHYFARSFVTKMLFLILGSQLLLGILGFSLIIFILGIGKFIGIIGLSAPWYSQVVSFTETFLCYLWSFSFLWISMLTLNHWNDLLSTIVTVNPQSIMDWTYIISSYLYVGTYDMAKDFFTCLFNNPKDLMNTKAIWEIILLKDTIGGASLYAWDSITQWAPAVIQPSLLLIKSYIRLTYNTITGFVGGSILWVWTTLVSNIASAITPTVPGLLQPMATGIGTRVASFIGASFIIFILRLLFGQIF